jgi:hypothetical protein
MGPPSLRAGLINARSTSGTVAEEEAVVTDVCVDEPATPESSFPACTVSDRDPELPQPINVAAARGIQAIVIMAVKRLRRRHIVLMNV